jgi:hypothetical protein
MTSALLAIALLPAANESHWLTSYDQAQRVARATGRPIFVVFRCEH